jgi:hypothetical protein
MELQTAERHIQFLEISNKTVKDSLHMFSNTYFKSLYLPNINYSFLIFKSTINALTIF